MNTQLFQHRLQPRNGFTITEISIVTVIMVLIMGAVFVALGQFAIISSQEDTYQDLRNDLLLTSMRLNRDIKLATNVLPQLDNYQASNTVLILRQPLPDATGNWIPGRFRHIVYRAALAPKGMIREIYDDSQPPQLQTRMTLNDAIIALGFKYSNRTITNVDNMYAINDVQYIIVSSHETQLNNTDAYYMPEDLLSGEYIRELMELGDPFYMLRYYIEYANYCNVEVVMAASTGSAAMRNKRSLGLKGDAPPTYDPYASTY